MNFRRQPAAVDTEGAEFLRMTAVVRGFGLCKSTIYRLIAEQNFPAPVKLTGRAVGWRRSDLERWSAGRKTNSH